MEYMIYDTEDKNSYLLSESEREYIRNRIKKGFLSGNGGVFCYNTEIKLNLVEAGTTIQELSEKAKKHLCKVISENLLKQGTDFTMAIKKVIRINRGESGLTIEDLKTFRTPLGKNGITFVILDIEAHVFFLKKNKKIESDIRQNWVIV